jgi:hypothetical protein
MDVTLKKGNVCLAATVSNGWWAGPISRNVYGKDVCKAFYCKLDVHYKDGTRETFVSDTTWRCSTEASPFLLGDGTILAAGSCLSVEKAESEKDRFVGTSDLGKSYWLCPLHDWFMN